VGDNACPELLPDVVTTDKSESKRERKEKKRRKIDPSSTSTESSCTPPKAASPHSKSSISFSASATTTPEEAESFLKKHSITIHTPKGTPNVTPVIRFSQLNVPSEIQSAFAGFKEPTPIQACTWPAALEGRDVVGIAETGRYLNFLRCELWF
jgi:ATP-dependent RNA helicase DBP3